jgi:hypothetical protein
MREIHAVELTFEVMAGPFGSSPFLNGSSALVIDSQVPPATPGVGPWASTELVPGSEGRGTMLVQVQKNVLSWEEVRCTIHGHFIQDEPETFLDRCISSISTTTVR